MRNKNSFILLLTFVVLPWLGLSKQCVSAGLTADKVLDRNHMVEVEIEMPPEDWQALCNQSRDFRTAFSNPTAKPYTYFKGNITIDGVKVSDAGIRKKGFIGSQDSYRPSLKVKFDEYMVQQPVDGLTQLTLNNNKQDRSLLSQSLTYYLFRRAGVHAPRCNFATVTVNGEYLGIYSHVESIKKPYLKNEFGDSSGKLYEGTLADFYPKGIGRLEAKTEASDKDRTKVMKLATLLNSEDAVSLDEVEAIVDVDNFLKFWAIESLIGFWDGYTQNQNNYFVYENPTNGKLYFMPWGADGCFGDSPPFGRFGRGRSIAVRADSMLANRLYHLDGMPERYRKTLMAILEETWNEDDLLKEVDRINEVIFDDLDELQLNCLGAMDYVRAFIRQRRKKIMAELRNDWPAVVESTPRKPMYTVEVGTAVGSFTSQWGTRSDGRNDNATIELRLDGADVEVEGVTATAGVAEWRGFGRSDRGESPNLPVSIVLKCETSDGRVLTLAMNVPKDGFTAKTAKKLRITGTLSDGQAGFGFPPGMGKTLQGEIVLEHAGTNNGDLVAGKFDLKIAEMRGGMMDRRRR